MIESEIYQFIVWRRLLMIYKHLRFSFRIKSILSQSTVHIFHAVRSLLAFSKFDSNKHSGIIAYFNQHFIKSGNIEVEYSKILTTAYKFRNDSDYRAFYIITREEAEFQLDKAKKFINRIQDYLKKYPN